MIRPAQMKDISRIAEIIVFGKRVAYRPIFNNDEGSFNELQVLNLIESYQNSPHLINNMLVYDDGIVKGIINYKDYGEEIELCDFYVEPFFKGKGIGGQLIQFLMDDARGKDKKKIFLWVIKDNVSARRFYESNGFRVNGQEQLIEGTNVLDVCYERNLLDIDYVGQTKGA